MSEHITGAEARGLLDGTTPAPWAWYWDTGLVSLKGAADDPVATDLNIKDSDLAAAAPDLAATVAWLYGREPDIRNGDDASHWGLGDGFTAYRIGRMVTIGDDDKHIVFTPDEAVDAARILLAAAEEARR